MKDPRMQKLADIIVTYSCSVQKGDKVLIETTDEAAIPLAELLVDRVAEAGGTAFVNIYNTRIKRKVITRATDEWYDIMREIDLARMKKMDAYINIDARASSSELEDVPIVKLASYRERYVQPVHFEERLNNTKWCSLAFPNPAYAQAAGMSQEAFTDFFYKVCTLDYGNMSKAMDPFAELLQKTDMVRITGPGRTDLRLSVKGLPAVKCSGRENIPDGEVFSAPVRDSVNGVIEFNTPTEYQGKRFENIVLTFKDGRITDFSGTNRPHLEAIFNTDEGARYTGEFAFGVNPYISKPMNDCLFDEKIAGSIHLTPGTCFSDCDNGNKSAIHWDLILIQTPEYGGGEIWFDDVLIRKDGIFVLPELKGLNPENLRR
ncbi:MAG: aminopeptidase [Spirochaetales bacterium]|nr:MAG: aminopeptidase [Spirochaetales bacterium]